MGSRASSEDASLSVLRGLLQGWGWGLRRRGGGTALDCALLCRRKGLTFVSVHDCFWTHAADVATMNQVPALSHPPKNLVPAPSQVLGQGVVTPSLRPSFPAPEQPPHPPRCAVSSLFACTASPSCTTCPGFWWSGTALAPGETAPPSVPSTTPSPSFLDLTLHSALPSGPPMPKSSSYRKCYCQYPRQVGPWAGEGRPNCRLGAGPF